jgi:hypothetical protein
MKYRLLMYSIFTIVFLSIVIIPEIFSGIMSVGVLFFIIFLSWDIFEEMGKDLVKELRRAFKK